MFFNYQKVSLFITVFVIGLFTFGFSVNHAQAVGGDITITVQDEFGTTLPGAAVTLLCPGGALPQTMTDIGGGQYSKTGITVTDPAGAGCDNGEAVTFTVTKTGYVTKIDSSHSYVAAGDSSFVLSGVQFQLKICLADQLGNTYPNVTTVTFDGHSATVRTGGCSYFAETGSNKTVVMNEPGFINNAITNTALSDVSASPSAQTLIQLGNYATRSSPITAGSSVTIKGLVYNLQSDELVSEIGGAISDIATGFDVDGTPSADVTITASGGCSVQASAVNHTGPGDIIYIALASCDGGGDDSFNVQLQNVTTSGGTTDGASLVSSAITDTGNTINGNTSSQLPFDIGGAHDATLSNVVGFQYPMIVTLADETGAIVLASTLDTSSFDGIAPYYVVDNYLYFANMASNGDLVLTKTGYTPSLTTNAGAFNNITLDGTAQTSIILGNYSAATTPITPGQSVNVKGLSLIVITPTTTSSNQGGTISGGRAYIFTPPLPVVTSMIIQRTLKPEMKGADVLAAQQYLKDHGFPCVPDGSFGLKTKKSVQLFQKAHGLKADGSIGALTRALMK